MAGHRVLMDIHEALLDALGPLGWWPADSPFEVMVGAVLTQNTNWKNVERAIDGLRGAGLLDAEHLAAADPTRIEELVRPSGYYRQKTARLLRLCRWLLERAGGDVAALAEAATDDLRAELVAINGIGPETADSILLYALDRCVFVVDAYTKRMAVRHGLVDADCGYAELADLFASALPDDVPLYREYHAQLVELGKRWCRPAPRCEECPLHALLGDPELDEFG
jgi:endonuclease-3 related protein